MRQLNLKIVTSKKIDVLGETSPKVVEKSNDLSSTLTNLFPEKKTYWGKKNWDKIQISFIPNLPFGPDPDVLTSFLFDTMEDDLNLLINHFSLKQISLYGIGNSRQREIPNIIYSKKENRKDLNLTALEASKLVKLIKNDKCDNNVLLSVFIDRENVFTYSLVEDMDFTTLFSTAETLKGHNLDDFIDTADGIPLIGGSIIGKTPIRHISKKNWRFESESNMLLTYPNFNRSISMVELDKKEEDPCINCLACASTCPADLYPAMLFHHLKDENLAEAGKMGLDLCTSCRRCSVVCPSNIPLSAKIIENMSHASGDNE